MSGCVLLVDNAYFSLRRKCSHATDVGFLRNSLSPVEAEVYLKISTCSQAIRRKCFRGDVTSFWSPVLHVFPVASRSGSLLPDTELAMAAGPQPPCCCPPAGQLTARTKTPTGDTCGSL